MKPASQKVILGLGFALGIGLLLFFIFRPTFPSSAKANRANTENAEPKTESNRSKVDSARRFAKNTQPQSSTNSGDEEDRRHSSAFWKGQVVNPAHQGIAQAEITIHSFTRALTQKHFKADEEGYFQLPRPTRLKLTLEVSAAGFLTRRLEFPQAGSGQEEKILLQPGGNLELRVLDENYRPVPGARISSTVNDAIETNEEGLAMLTKLRNPASLSIQADGFNDLQLSFPLESAQKDVTLLRNGFFQGVVLDADDGSPVQEFSIRWTHTRPPGVFRSYQNPQGHFEAGDLPRQQASFIIAAPDYLTQKVPLEETLPKGQTRRVEVRLEKSGIFFSGKVSSVLKLELVGARITALIGGRMDLGERPGVKFPHKQNGEWVLDQEPWIDTLETQTDSQGYFEIGPFPRASYISFVTIAAGHAPEITRNLETLLEDARHNLHIQPKPFAKISGKAGQESYPGHRLVSMRDKSQHQTDLLLGPGEQDFQFEEVIPGRTRVWLRAEAGDHLATGELPPIIPDEEILQTYPYGSFDVELGFHNKLTLGGRILLDKQPMANSAVVVHQKDPPTRFFRTQTDELGQFRFFPLREGTYEVMANGSAEDDIFGERNRQIVDLQESQTDLQFEFQSMGHVFGRIVSEPVGSQIIMEIKYPAGNRTIVNSRKTTIVQSQGFFEFAQVPSGQFSLTLNTFSNASQSLIREVTMPADGQDLDLGDLGEKAGVLTISLSGPEDFPNARVIFNQHIATQDGVSTQLLGSLTPADAALELSGLKVGKLKIQALAPRGFSVEPFTTEIVIDQDLENQVQFELSAQTHIRVGFTDPLGGLGFKSGQLFHEGTERYWNIPFVTDTPSPSITASPQLYMSRNHVFAEAIPEGWWQLHVQSQGGLVANRRFRLRQGKPVMFGLSFADFMTPE